MQKKNDYKSMRLIDNETYAQIVALLAQDAKVALFQKLLLSQKAEPEENQPDKIKTESEVKNELSESNAESKARNNRY